MTKLKVPLDPKDHAQGPADAPVTLVEYGDYECPHCGHAYPIVKQLQQEFAKDMRFIFRNFPLSNAHPHAELAAESAESAAEQGKFWEMHDWLFENQQDLSAANIVAGARQLGLDARRLSKDIESRQYQERVRHDFSGGVHSEVRAINAEIRTWANTMRRKASATRAARSVIARASGRRFSGGVTSRSDTKAPMTRPTRI